MYTTIPRIPYFKTSRYRVSTMLELSQAQKGEKMVDLGSGDGRIAIEFAKKGVISTGYELDPTLLQLSVANAFVAGVSTITTFTATDFWNEDLSIYDIITIYPMPDIMNALEQKLQKVAKKNTRILLNYYPFPQWKPTTLKDNIYLYKGGM